ncbi:ABC transporter substrate-binding protein [Halobacillus sp. BAB-2008]|uniref:ABC transporter substrate-binding protein n=1 Tax=Halobacillus sp. BAB-2008 TaxID=1246484 RepID=UPI0002A4D617|nr:ABC transporter substrate-binding protein [Halobacillus sp. BAB-2008]ELK48697.1 ABC-type transport system extracellular binding protein [Halobacillus sp. BAB-2008]
MNKFFSLMLFLAALVFLSACSQEPNSTDWSDQSWQAIESASENTTVRLHMWGGDESINQYIDEWAAPRMKEQFGVTLERVPMDTPEILQKLQTEKQAGKQDGSIDLIWLNGENFKNAKENKLLSGTITDGLPNFQKYYDTDSPAFQKDFGTEVDGMEAPWGKVQFVFFYDSAKIENPPETFEELQTWIHENPGKFTYPRAEDFSGNAFLRHILYAKADKPSDIYDQPLDEETIQPTADQTWDYLKDIEEDLWRSGEHYPNDLTELDRLYSEGEVWMTMGYNEARAESLIEEGVFPETTKSFVMDPGSIGNTHFLSVPFNSPNKPGALTTINFLLSPEAQLAKLQPDSWGDNTPISLDLLPEEQKQQFEAVDRGDSVLPVEKLEESFLPESAASYVEWMTEEWFNEIVQD